MSGQTRSSPGHWIAKDIHPQTFTHTDLEKLAESYRVLQQHAIAQGKFDLPENQFSVMLYIYCPPCACQVAVALDICRSVKIYPYLDVRIRVDHRQPTSCSMLSSRIDGLASLIGYVKSQESKSTLSGLVCARVNAIDRQWLEQTVYDYEEEVQVRMSSPENQLSHIVNPHQNEGLCAAVVILGEADFCIPLMGATPFPPFKTGKIP